MIGASTALECLKKFTLGIMEVFGKEYLRKPNQVDVDHLLQVAKGHDFLDILGNIDCIHYGRIFQRVERNHFKRNFTRC